MLSFEEMEEMYEIITMENEDGSQESFFIINSLDHDEIPYFLVIDAIEEADYDKEVLTYIMRGTLVNDSEYVFEMLEESKEYDVVMQLFEDNEDDM